MITNIDRRSVIFFLSLLLTGCGLLLDRNSEIISGKWNSHFTDNASCRSICKSDTIGEYGGGIVVEPYVFAIGHNHKYIIAKRHPNEKCEFKVDTSKTEYFIINMKEFNYRGNGLYGPLDKICFDSISKSLNIYNIRFDMIYERQPNVFAR